MIMMIISNVKQSTKLVTTKNTTDPDKQSRQNRQYTNGGFRLIIRIPDD